jgi:antitoxin (DNA-binding transcriptional repressor) of toxin-antitoxin stability system
MPLASRAPRAATSGTNAEASAANYGPRTLSKYLHRVTAGEDLVATQRGAVVARLTPAGASADVSADLVTRFGANVPVEPLEVIASGLPRREAPTGTTDAFLAESRSDRAG